MTDFGVNVYATLKRSKHTVQELADTMGVSRTYVCRTLHDDKITDKARNKFTDALSVLGAEA